jgi:hypothetical protein
MNRRRTWEEREDAIRALHLEALVTAQAGTAHDWRAMDGVLGDVPGRFIAVELGLARGQGPSVFWTQDHLPNINKANLHALLDPPSLQVERRKRAKQTSQAMYQRRFRRALASLGYKQAA